MIHTLLLGREVITLSREEIEDCNKNLSPSEDKLHESNLEVYRKLYLGQVARIVNVYQSEEYSPNYDLLLKDGNILLEGVKSPYFRLT